MSKFLFSHRVERLATGVSARQRRAEIAIRALGIPREFPIDCLRATNQASASTCKVGPLQLLVSYTTVVACNLADGSSIATPRNYYSRTTDASVDRFVKGYCERVTVERFGELVKFYLGLSR